MFVGELQRVNDTQYLFEVAAFKLFRKHCSKAYLGGANRRKVSWMTEEKAPRTANPVMKLNLALGALYCEIWGVSPTCNAMYISNYGFSNMGSK